MYTGWTSLCLKVADLDASTRFYEAIGFEFLERVGDLRVVLRHGPFRIALMTFLEENLLNVRGADVFAMHERLVHTLPGLEGEPERYTPETIDADAPGECWATRDPDGNQVFFDTNRNEDGANGVQRRIQQILEDAELELGRVGASSECLAALREHVIEPYGQGGEPGS